MFAGVVAIDRAIADALWAARLRRGWLAGMAVLVPTTWWMRELSAPGWVLASVLLAALLGGGAVGGTAGRLGAVRGGGEGPSSGSRGPAEAEVSMLELDHMQRNGANERQVLRLSRAQRRLQRAQRR